MPRAGDIVGGCYRLVRLLGKGMFGQVYEQQRRSSRLRSRPSTSCLACTLTPRTSATGSSVAGAARLPGGTSRDTMSRGTAGDVCHLGACGCRQGMKDEWAGVGCADVDAVEHEQSSSTASIVL